MTANDAIIARVIAREGGFVDHPADRGGPTKFGLSQQFLSGLWGRPVPPDVVKALTRSRAWTIYKAEFLIGPNFHKIEYMGLREQVFDAGVLHGTEWAARRLQEVAGASVDGIVGPRTIAAVNATSGLHTAFLRRRVRRIGRIVQRDHTQIVFLVGWLDRASSFLET